MVSTQCVGKEADNRYDSTNSERKDTQEISNLQNFHAANIQNLISSGDKGLYMAKKEKIAFLREKCEEGKPYFLAFAETFLNERIKVSEYEIEGYCCTASHRMRRIGGGDIIYVRNDLTYQNLNHGL